MSSPKSSAVNEIDIAGVLESKYRRISISTKAISAQLYNEPTQREPTGRGLVVSRSSGKIPLGLALNI